MADERSDPSPLARALVEERQYDAAIGAFHQAIASDGVQLLEAQLGHAYAASGQRDKARQVLSNLSALSIERSVSPYDMAIVHTGLGDRDRAIAWLEKSYAARERWMVTLKIAPAFDSPRSDRRFADLVQRVGLWR